jgi:lycopene beta-cyclase
VKRIVVVGAGAAGLSFAYYLSAATRDPFHCILVDPDTKEENDRTWAFWGEQFDLDHLVSHRWSRLQLRNGETLAKESGGYRYIRADHFYRHCRSRLAGDNRFSFFRGRAEAIEEGEGGAKVLLCRLPGGEESSWNAPPPDAGREVIEADLVVDTVFGPLEKEVQILRQSFVGWEVEAKRPSWDPDTATLMDFEVEAPRFSLEFFYTLPFDDKRALVEFTAVDTCVPPAGYLEERVEAYLDRRLGKGRWEVLRREKGTIPLYPDLAPGRSGRVYHLGVAAGAARPSTGYAFRSILETSAALVGQLAPQVSLTGSRLPEVPRVPHANRRPRFFDAVFLELLRREPEAIPRALMALFERNETARVFRFLSARSSLLDELFILAGLPWLPFLRAFRALLGKGPAGRKRPFQKAESAYELS